MKYFLFSIIILTAVLLQVSFLPHFKIYNVIPDLFLLVIISWVILRRYRRAYLWAMFGGIFLDLNSQILFGASTLSFVFAVLFLYLIIRSFINVANLVSKIILVLLGTLVYRAIFVLLLAAANSFRLYQNLDFLSPNFVYFILIEIILNIILIFLVYPFIKSVHHFIVRYEARKKISS